jgi:hypothetical protein
MFGESQMAYFLRREFQQQSFVILSVANGSILEK